MSYFGSDKNSISQNSMDDIVLNPLVDICDKYSLNPLKNQLSAMRNILKEDMDVIEKRIDELQKLYKKSIRSNGNPDLSEISASHLLGLSGKRIRPLCVLLGAHLGNCRGDKIVYDFAIACELVHSATLLHDDVIDNSQKRRSAPTACVLYGNAASIFAGDYLLIKALKLVLKSGYHEVLEKMLKVIDQIIAAEVSQLERRGNFDPSREDYIKIISGKTASLFCWSLYAGAMRGNLDPEKMDILENIGQAMGMAFQLTDDIIDISLDKQKTNKDVFNDVREGKLTWPLILGSERIEGFEKELLYFTQESTKKPDTKKMIKLYHSLLQYDVISDTLKLAEKYVQKALSELQKLPKSPVRTSFELVIQSIIYRVSIKE